MEPIGVTATKNMVLMVLTMVLQKVQTVTGRSICDIFNMICGLADTHAITLKQLDGLVIVISYCEHTYTAISVAILQDLASPPKVIWEELLRHPSCKEWTRPLLVLLAAQSHCR